MQIEQIDRDAAAGFFDVAGWHGKGGSIRKGLRDDEPLVQAFAAHRLAARPDDSAVERIVDAVIDAANIVSHDGYYEIDRDAATRAAIAALGEYRVFMIGGLVWNTLP